jgi:hypothetical protein
MLDYCYRIVKHPLNGYQIWKLLIDSHNILYFCATSPAMLSACSVEELKSNYKDIQEAFEKEIVLYDNIKRLEEVSIHYKF